MSDKKNQIQNFYKRWNIEYDQEKRISDFKNRVLYTIDNFVVPFFDKINDDGWLLRYFKSIGIYVSRDIFKSYDYNKDNGYRFIFNEHLNHKINNGKIEEIIFYFQMLFNFMPDIKNYNQNKSFKEILYLELKENIDLSLLDIEIKKIKDKFIIYPAGVKLLDKSVVDDVIAYLDSYPGAQKHFISALQKHQEHKYERNLIDDLRFSLELLLRNILNNRKSLEKQINTLGEYLKNKNISVEINNMFMYLINCYKDYQNEHAKHGDKINEAEIEFMIYLTGTIMRFLLNL